MSLEVLNLKLQQIFPEKLGPDCSVYQIFEGKMSEIHMIETRPKKIESKPLKSKYRANYNHHTWKFDMGQKLDIIDMAVFDSSTWLYYLVNLLARVRQNYSLFLDARGLACQKFTQKQKKKKKLFGFLSNISFIICGICIFDATWDRKSQSCAQDPTNHLRRSPSGKQTMAR